MAEVPQVSLRQFLHRADKAVEDTKTSVTTSAVIAVAALVVAVVAVIVAVVLR
jgi:hypothetical protein